MRWLEHPNRHDLVQAARMGDLLRVAPVQNESRSSAPLRPERENAEGGHESSANGTARVADQRPERELVTCYRAALPHGCERQFMGDSLGHVDYVQIGSEAEMQPGRTVRRLFDLKQPVTGPVLEQCRPIQRRECLGVCR